jgi:signal recognition particle receptor subunit beta
MVFFNYATMQMAAKIVYYGPGLCGKTTNLQQIYQKTSPQSRGEMVSLETETDRTLFFDLLPIDVGVIGGFKTRLQLYTVPGQVFYNTTRKLVLKGVDGIVFVADSQRAMLEANVESLKNLRENLAEIGLDLDEIPVVVQLNKRDLPNIADADTMLQAIDPEGRFEHVEAIAASGVGVFETLKVISKLTLRTLRRRMTGDEPTKQPSNPRTVAQFRVHGAEGSARTLAGSTPIPQTTHAFGSAAPAAAPSFAPAATVAEPIAPELARDVPTIAPAPDVFPDEPLAATADVSADSIAVAPVAAPPAPENDYVAPPSIEEPRAAEPEIDFSRTEKPQPTAPPKTVKVRSSVDVMAELEALRKRATTSTTATPKAARKELTLADLNIPRPKRDVQRTLHLSLPADLLPRAKSVRVTLSFEDGEAGVIDTRDQQIELGDTTDIQSLSVNLKIDLA